MVAVIAVAALLLIVVATAIWDGPKAKTETGDEAGEHDTAQELAESLRLDGGIAYLGLLLVALALFNYLI